MTEARNGDILLTDGCDSNFDAELIFYESVWTIIEKLLKQAGSSIIEFLNLPVTVINFLIDAVKFPFKHMGDVCSILGGAQSVSKEDAVYENSRLALRELACRDLADLVGEVDPLLKRGYGCDGIDNTCDDDGAVDECAEDIFPPILDLTLARQFCEGQTFQTEQEGIDCIFQHSFAEDDCRPVILTAAATPDTEGTMEPTIIITAIAQGCGNRTVEDTTIDYIPIEVDGGNVVVTCGFEKPQNINHVTNPPPGFVADGTMTPPFPLEGEPLFISSAEEDKNIVDVKFVYNITVSGTVQIVLVSMGGTPNSENSCFFLINVFRTTCSLMQG